MNQPTAAELQEELRAFHEGFRSVIMGTVDGEGIPEASYAPFVRGDAGDIYVFVSDLSQHTQNLTHNRRASLLFIEDEGSSPNLYARRRLNLRCSASLIPREDPRWTSILDQFAQQFGNIVDTLRTLSDFRLICLTPEAGSYVRGFGQAYDLTGPHLDTLHHVRPGKSQAPRNQ